MKTCTTCPRAAEPGLLRCRRCIEARFFVDRTPEWVKRAERHELPIKEWGRAA